MIATPEGIDLELTLAGAGSRFAAALVDALLQLVLSLALWAVLVLGIGGYGVALFAVAAFLVVFGYHVLFEVLASGRTPGKRCASGSRSGTTCTGTWAATRHWPRWRGACT